MAHKISTELVSFFCYRSGWQVLNKFSPLSSSVRYFTFRRFSSMFEFPEVREISSTVWVNFVYKAVSLKKFIIYFCSTFVCYICSTPAPNSHTSVLSSGSAWKRDLLPFDTDSIKHVLGCLKPWWKSRLYAPFTNIIKQRPKSRIPLLHKTENFLLPGRLLLSEMLVSFRLRNPAASKSLSWLTSHTWLAFGAIIGLNNLKKKLSWKPRLYFDSLPTQQQCCGVGFVR